MSPFFITCLVIAPTAFVYGLLKYETFSSDYPCSLMMMTMKKMMMIMTRASENSWQNFRYDCSSYRGKSEVQNQSIIIIPRTLYQSFCDRNIHSDKQIQHGSCRAKYASMPRCLALLLRFFLLNIPSDTNMPVSTINLLQ